MMLHLMIGQAESDACHTPTQMKQRLDYVNDLALIEAAQGINVTFS